MDLNVARCLGLVEELENIPEWRETGEMIPSRLIAGPDMVPERRIYFIPSRRWVSPWIPVES